MRALALTISETKILRDVDVSDRFAHFACEIFRMSFRLLRSIIASSWRPHSQNYSWKEDPIPTQYFFLKLVIASWTCSGNVICFHSLQRLPERWTKLFPITSSGGWGQWFYCIGAPKNRWMERSCKNYQAFINRKFIGTFNELLWIGFPFNWRYSFCHYLSQSEQGSLRIRGTSHMLAEKRIFKTH